MDWLNDEQGVPLTIATLERMAIVNALNHTGWCASRTAAILEIGRSTLYRKLEEYGIGRSDGVVVEIVATPRPIPPIGETARRFLPGTFGSPEDNEALAEMMRAMRAEASPGDVPPIVSGPESSC